jgi:hypothetical protein
MTTASALRSSPREIAAIAEGLGVRPAESALPQPEPDALAAESPAFDEGAAPLSRDEMIAVAAYYRAERRGFAPGAELEDWLAAEAEIDGAAAAG